MSLRKESDDILYGVLLRGDVSLAFFCEEGLTGLRYSKSSDIQREQRRTLCQ